MHKMGMDLDIISRSTELTHESVEKIINEDKTSPKN